jgi:AraC-like DNA-binding protein
MKEHPTKLHPVAYHFLLGYPAETDRGTMYYISHAFEAQTKLHSLPASEFLGLYFNLGTELRYEVTGASPRTIKHNQYNLVYVPRAGCDLTFPKGEYVSFCLMLTGPYLRLIADTFEAVRAFVEKNDLKISSVMHEEHLPITPDIREKINDVIHNEFSGVAGEFFLKARFIDILILSLEHHEKHLFAGLEKTEIEKVRQTHDRILQNIREPHSVNRIADELSIAQRKLEKGFKILFHTTVYNFIIDQRMKKAVELLHGTTKPVGEIAASVGYTVSQVFSNAFKKKFGCTPTQFRKGEKQK